MTLWNNAKGKFLIIAIVVLVCSTLVAVFAYRDVELHAVVDRVRLLLAQIPFDARAAQHRPGEAERERALGRDDADADGALLPDAVLGQQRLVVVDGFRKAVGEVLDEVQQRPLPVLIQLLDLLFVFQF